MKMCDLRDEASKVLVLLLIISTVQVDGYSCPRFRLQLIAALQKYFKVGCTFLIYVNDSIYKDKAYRNTIVYMQTRLNKDLHAVTTMSMSSMNSSYLHLHCHSARALSVIIPGDQNSKTNIEKLFSRFHLASPYWLLLLDDTVSEPQDYLQSVNIPFDYELLVAQGCQQVCLTEAFRVAAQFPLETCVWGTWSSMAGLRAPSARLYERRRDLKGVTFTAAINHDPLFEMVLPQVDGTLAADGYFPEIIRHLGEMLNFTFTVVRAANNSGGVLQPDGTWTGIMGMFVRGEIDLTLNRYYMSSMRLDYIDFSDPLIISKAAVIIRTPDGSEHAWNIYLSPFSHRLWFTVAATITFLACYMTVFHKLHRLLKHEESERNLWDSLLCELGASCMQGHSSTPTQWSARTVHWISFVTAIIILTSYSATFTSFLTVQKVTLPFSTMEEILEDKTHRFAVQAAGGVYSNFQGATDKVMRELFLKKIVPHRHLLPTSIQDGFRRICREKIAFMDNVDALASCQAIIKCPLTVLHSASFPLYMAIGLRNNSAYRGAINYLLRKMYLGGTLRKLYLSKWPQPPASFTEPTMTSVGVINIVPLLQICGGGCVLSICILLLEKFYQRTISVLRSQHASNKKIAVGDFNDRRRQFNDRPLRKLSIRKTRNISPTFR